MQDSSAQEKAKVTLTDKILAAVAVLTLAAGMAASYSTNQSTLAEHEQSISALWTRVGDLEGTNERLTRVEEKIDNLSRTNDKTLEVLQRLAESVDKLSVSVGRLDERTNALERNER